MRETGEERCDEREVEGFIGAYASWCSGGKAQVENGTRELGFWRTGRGKHKTLPGDGGGDKTKGYLQARAHPVPWVFLLGR